MKPRSKPDVDHADFLSLVERQSNADKETVERLEAVLRHGPASQEAAERLGFEPFGYCERN